MVTETQSPLFLLRPHHPAQKEIAPQLTAAVKEVESLVAAELAKDNLGSVSAGIIYGSDLIWAKSFGQADMEQKIPASG